MSPGTARGPLKGSLNGFISVGVRSRHCSINLSSILPHFLNAAYWVIRAAVVGIRHEHARRDGMIYTLVIRDTGLRFAERPLGVRANRRWDMSKGTRNGDIIGHEMLGGGYMTKSGRHEH